MNSIHNHLQQWQRAEVSLHISQSIWLRVVGCTLEVQLLGLVHLYRALSKSGGKSEDEGGRSPMPLQLGFWDCSEEPLGCACAWQEDGGAWPRLLCASPPQLLLATGTAEMWMCHATSWTEEHWGHGWVCWPWQQPPAHHCQEQHPVPLWMSITTWMISARAPHRGGWAAGSCYYLGLTLSPSLSVEEPYWLTARLKDARVHQKGITADVKNHLYYQLRTPVSGQMRHGGEQRWWPRTCGSFGDRTREHQPQLQFVSYSSWRGRGNSFKNE